MDGYYYLHTNGDLIYKHQEPEMESGGFVRKVWHINTTDRASAWTILLEALAMEADITRIKELANKWNCDARDLPNYLARTKGTDLQRKGLRMFLSSIIGVDPDAWFDWLAATPKGNAPNFAIMPVGHGA